MKKTLALVLALAMCLALLTACGGGGGGGTETGSGGEGGGGTAAGEDITLRFSAHDPETSDIMIAAQNYFDQINEATDGHVTVEMLASGVVASAATVGDMVSSGGVDMGWVLYLLLPHSVHPVRCHHPAPAGLRRQCGRHPDAVGPVRERA